MVSCRPTDRRTERRTERDRDGKATENETEEETDRSTATRSALSTFVEIILRKTFAYMRPGADAFVVLSAGMLRERTVLPNTRPK